MVGEKRGVVVASTKNGMCGDDDDDDGAAVLFRALSVYLSSLCLCWVRGGA